MPALQPLRFGPYQLDRHDGQLVHHDQVVHLPPKALAVLWELASQAGQVVPKDALLATVWADTVVSEGVIAARIRDLRQALGDAARRPRYIETVHRRSYRFVAPVERLAMLPPGGTAAAQPAVLSPRLPAGLVGREAEMAQLDAALDGARGGQRQVLFVAGEAGIGKTTLVEAWVASLEAQGAGAVAWGQCVKAYGAGIGYLPVLEALGRLCQGPAGATVIDHLRQWAPTWLAQLTGMLSPAEHERLHHHARRATRERRLRELAAVLEALTATQTLVLVLEDLHWSDASTVDVLTMLARRRETARLIVLGTYRPVELILHAHPLRQAITELRLHGQCAELALRALQPQAVEAYAVHRFPEPVAHVIGPVMYQRTAGHPLFMVHLAEYVAQQVGLSSRSGEALATQIMAAIEVIPAGVQQLINLQLERLSVDEQHVLEMASAAGTNFAVASVAAGLQMPLEQIEAVCEELVQRGPFLEACGLASWPDGTVSGQYQFRHALYQQVCYRRLMDVRQMQAHQRIGARLEAGYGSHAGEMAAELAVHFERGQLTERAIRYRAQAGKQALANFAYPEAIRHLTVGLELLTAFLDTPERLEQELDLQVMLGTALMNTKGQGVPEVQQTYARAWDLCQQIGDTPHSFSVLRGLMLYYQAQGKLHTAYQLGEQLLRLARSQNDSAHLLLAHYQLGLISFYLGEPALAHGHHTQGLSIYTPQEHRFLTAHYGLDLGITSHSWLSWGSWQLGYPEQALKHNQAARTLAEETSQPYNLAQVVTWSAVLHQLCHNVPVVREQATAAMALATEQGFAQRWARGMVLHGWSLAMQGQSETGIAEIRQGLAASLTAGAKMLQLYALVLLAEAYGESGHADKGLRLLAEAMALMETTEARFYEAEFSRLKGTLLLKQTVPEECQAESCFRTALDVARAQQAKSWELRAATSLSRLWQQQGKRRDAYTLLSETYAWFTEGFDTADLQDARALLETLSTPEARS